MKLKFDVENKAQPDPFIVEHDGKFFIYVTAKNGVEAYSANDVFGTWHFEGIVFKMDGCTNYWAPSLIKIKDTYYIYVSCQKGEEFEYMYVAKADNPLGPFECPKRLFDRFTIDPHMVKTPAGLFLFYAEDNTDCERIGTRIFIDKFSDPYTPQNLCREIISPSMDEEIYKRNRNGDGKDWHTLEGPFWFYHDGWQYIMYSAACYENDTYHIGYASAKSENTDLTQVEFTKHTDNGKFAPVLFKNDIEEGVGHHSVICISGIFYAVYHGRDVKSQGFNDRTARICKLNVNNGIITAERL